MAEIKWIKITTDIFDDEKMKIIDKYPARDEILVVWFKLLSLAGKVNQSGLLFMSNKIPYTVDMLSAVFNREEKTIQMALSVFQKFGMITVEDNEVISICNWDKHQNVDSMEKIREQSRVRMARSRANKDRLLLSDNKLRNGCVTVTDCYAIDKEEDKDKDKEEDKDKKVPVPYQEIVESFNRICKSLSNVITLSDKRKEKVKTRYQELGSIDAFEGLFFMVEQSDFLKGKAGGWKCTFDWLMMNDTNYLKVLEGQYANNAKEQKSSNPFKEMLRKEMEDEQATGALLIDNSKG